MNKDAKVFVQTISLCLLIVALLYGVFIIEAGETAFIYQNF